MLKIKQEVIAKGGNTKYILDVGQGRFVEGELPIKAVCSMVEENKGVTKALSHPGYVKVGLAHYFPEELFEDEPKPTPKRTPKKA